VPLGLPASSATRRLDQQRREQSPKRSE
jgi:hypothetical protein